MLGNMHVGPARSVDISPDGEMIAVGLKDGSFNIINATNFKLWGKKRDRGQMINDVRYGAVVKFKCIFIMDWLLRRIPSRESSKRDTFPVNASSIASKIEKFK